MADNNPPTKPRPQDNYSVQHDRYYVFLCGCVFKNYTQRHNERRRCPVHKAKIRFIATTCGRSGCNRHFIFRPTHGNRRLCSAECQAIVGRQYARNYWIRKKQKIKPKGRPPKNSNIKNWMTLNDFFKIYYSQGFLRPAAESEALKEKLWFSKTSGKETLT